MESTVRKRVKRGRSEQEPQEPRKPQSLTPRPQPSLLHFCPLFNGPQMGIIYRLHFAKNQGRGGGGKAAKLCTEEGEEGESYVKERTEVWATS